MKYFLDTEFIESVRTIDLISIGIVCEDGREFYAESWAIPWDKASGWVLDNVKPHLTGENVLDRSDMKKDILQWVLLDTEEAIDLLEIWSMVETSDEELRALTYLSKSYNIILITQ